MILLLLLTAGLMIDGLPGGELLWREVGSMEYEIAVSYDGGDYVSLWVLYPLNFNPVKTICYYIPEDSTIKVVSQQPYSAECTRAWFLINSDRNITLSDEGGGGYYRDVFAEVERLFQEDDYTGAFSAANEVMYPRAMPDAEELCVLFVVKAADIGTLEFFEMADDISFQYLGVRVYQIQSDEPEYFTALNIYSKLADPETAQLVLERLGNHE